MDTNQYDFILNPAQQKKMPGGGLSKQKRILILGIGVILLVIIVIFLFSIITSGRKETRELLYPVAAAQQDILDITDEGAKKLRDPDLLKLTASVNLVVTTHYTETSSTIGKDAKKLIAPYQSDDFTQTLEEAEQTGAFDDRYEIVLSNRLDIYKQSLVTAYAELNNSTIKKKLETYNTDIDILTGKQTAPTAEKTTP